ncbi:hypothetical protein skT53_17140 [Effusibacillus dendaii]|uniref:Transcription regulator YsiA C-terminal domain-containing protein n=1 Tax=Effusibacillus dendaii TaxID=2743772 RepID=A0A7I8DCP8_9BACL|nr:hypothetical protein skT53_17140 [Effusibacillus dendaii]
MVTVYFEGLAHNKSLAAVTQIHLRQADQAMRRQIGDIIRPYYQLIDHIIQDGIDKGIFRPTIDHRIARRMIFGTMDETITAWVLTGAKYDLQGLIEPVVDLLVHAMKK